MNEHANNRRHIFLSLDYRLLFMVAHNNYATVYLLMTGIVLGSIIVAIWVSDTVFKY